MEFLTTIWVHADEFSVAFCIPPPHDRARFIIVKGSQIGVQIHFSKLAFGVERLVKFLDGEGAQFGRHGRIVPRLLTVRKGALQMNYPFPQGFGLR